MKSIIISGPSGAGKSTIINFLLKNFDQFRLSVSHTTRPIRTAEKHGIDYFFVGKEVFEQKIQENFFFEYEIYNGNYYGTSFDEINKNEKQIILDLERKGVLNARNQNFDAIYIFIYCKKDTIFERLKKRMGKVEISKGEEQEILNRLGQYDSDIEVMNRGAYDFIIENEDLALAKKKVCEVLNLRYPEQNNQI